jgi:inner membrane protein
MPVEQYQQSIRSIKYAALIILLTFTVIFFTEIMQKTRIHALQYLLVGLALCLFYSLLLSMSEHIGFGMAYLAASVLTIALVWAYMLGIIKKKKPAFTMMGLLSILYLYVFILIQLETFALLAGSLGLFVILAVVMYFSKKIDWFNE